MPYLITDLRNGKGVLYGKAGDEVTVIGDRHDHVRIVEHVGSKERFSVLVIDLSETKIFNRKK